MKKIGSVVGPLSLALAMTLGIYAAWVILLACGVSLIDSRSRYDQVMMLEDGTVVIATRSIRNYTDVVYRNLDGSPHAAVDTTDAYTPGTFVAASGSANVGRGWSSRLRSYVTNRPQRTYWYYVADRTPPARLYFVGFEPGSKARVGYLGRNGFSKTKPAADEQFAEAQVARTIGWYGLYEPNIAISSQPGDTEWPAYVSSGDTLYQIDFGRGKVRPILRQPGIVSMVHLSHLPPSDPSQAFSPLVIRTRTQILLLRGETTPPDVYEIPAELRPDNFYIYVLPDKTILAQVFATQVPPRQEFLLFNAHGDVLRRYEWPGATTPMGAMWLVSALAASPSFDTLLTAAIIPISETGTRPMLSYSAALHQTMLQMWPGLAINYLLGIAAAFTCVRRQRRYGLPATAIWAGFTFLLGIPGLLGYLCHRPRPPLADCPACGQLVPRDRLACRDCGQPFPRPARHGTEIFA